MARVTRALQSSWLTSASWDSETGEMTVRARGRSYDYRNVPQEVFEALCDAPSAGDYYHASIKNRFG